MFFLENSNEKEDMSYDVKFNKFLFKNPGTLYKVLLFSEIFPDRVEPQKISIGKTVGQSRIDNPFTLIRRYSSKSYSSLLDYYMKLSHCHVDVTATTLGADSHIDIHIHLNDDSRLNRILKHLLNLPDVVLYISLD